MKALVKVLAGVLVVVLSSGAVFGVIAQESVQTPSQKTTEAVGKLIKTPAAVGKSVDAMTEAAKAKLQQLLGEKPEINTKAEPADIFVPPRKTAGPESSLYDPRGRRDPFQPNSVKPKSDPGQRQRQLDESLPPILRYDIAEFRLVGIAGYDKNQKWKALVLAPDKKSYTLSVGMDIGSSKGRVKAINSSEIVLEENSADKKSKGAITWSCIVGKLCSKPSVSTNPQSEQ